MEGGLISKHPREFFRRRAGYGKAIWGREKMRARFIYTEFRGKLYCCESVNISKLNTSLTPPSSPCGTPYVVERAYSKWLMSVAISLRFSWFYGPFVGGWIGGIEIDGAQFVNGEFIGGEKWKRDTIVRNW